MEVRWAREGFGVGILEDAAQEALSAPDCLSQSVQLPPPPIMCVLKEPVIVLLALLSQLPSINYPLHLHLYPGFQQFAMETLLHFL